MILSSFNFINQKTFFLIKNNKVLLNKKMNILKLSSHKRIKSIFIN